MRFEKFLINIPDSTISWEINGKLVLIKCENLDNARAFPKANLVLVLVGKNDNYPSTLIGFSEKGVRKFEVNASEGFKFSYLTEHPTAGVAVVCVANKRIEGWMDWHFSVNPSTGVLKRHCPAY
jgi:hypothetical protein